MTAVLAGQVEGVRLFSHRDLILGEAQFDAQTILFGTWTNRPTAGHLPGGTFGRDWSSASVAYGTFPSAMELCRWSSGSVGHRR